MSIATKKIGISEVDNHILGIPNDDFAVVETDSSRLGLAFLCNYIYQGLKDGEKCVLVTHQPIKYLLKNMKYLGINVESYIETKQLTILNYVGNIKTEISLTGDYHSIFEEIISLSSKTEIDRIAIHQMDTLLNLSNQFLINNTVHKFASMCRSGITSKTSILCEFQNYQDQAHFELSISLQKLASGYYKLSRVEGDDEDWSTVNFQTLKQPWLKFNEKVKLISLSRFPKLPDLLEMEDEVA